MNPIHHLRSDREDCLVGDFIAAADVLEWSTTAAVQDYQPLGGSLTAAALDAVAGDQGGAFSPVEGPWVFELEPAKAGDELPGPVWRRVS